MKGKIHRESFTDEELWTVARAVVEEEGLVAHHFRSYEYFVREGLMELVVEQDAYLAMSVSDRTYVIESGSVVMEGRSAELMANDDVKSRYLGI